MKLVFIALLTLCLFGCQCGNENFVSDGTTRYNGWKLEYSEKVHISDQMLYNCAYRKWMNSSAAAFSILTNKPCKMTLDSNE